MTQVSKRIYICVDMGMTGSSAQWMDNQKSTKWLPVFSNKVPTQLSYVELNGDQVVGPWGHECATLQRAAVRDRFKLEFGQYSNQDVRTLTPWGCSPSRKDIARWIFDYLQKLCAAIIQRINEVIGYDCTKHEIHWNFSRPGSWSAATQLDFRCLAERAVLLNSTATDKVKVLSDFTEGNAAAMVLLTTKLFADKNKFSIGNRIITCDMGGATTDIAVAYINTAGVLITMEQEAQVLLGFVTMERSFQKHMSGVLQSAKIHDAKQVALDFARSKDFQVVCKEVGKGADTDWFKFSLLPDYLERSWKSSNDTTSYATFIQNGAVLIHRKTIISFFDNFIKEIETAIDVVRAKLEPNHSATAIGFCGGVSQYMYCMDSFRRRYQDVPVLDPNHFGFRPEMATVIGSTQLWDQSIIKDFALNTLIGVMIGDTMNWSGGAESLEPPTFDVPFRWTTSLFGNKSRLSHDIQICAIPKIAGNPRTLKEALAVSGSRSWIAQIPKRFKFIGLEWGKMGCKIECDIIGVNFFEIKVVCPSTGDKVVCEVLEVQ